MSRPARILVADDEDLVRAVVARALAAAGYVVDAVSDVSAAFEAAEVHPPDLVVSDVDMPGSSGLDLCRGLGDIVGRPTPVILLSGRSAEADILAGFDAGAVDYLIKPFNEAELLAKVRMHLRDASLSGGPGTTFTVRHQTLADGRVRLVEQIGVGGMGAVYRGEDARLGKTVAVKVLRPDMAADPDFVVRFLREARVLSRLRLPGVPQVHDVGRDGNRYYYVMDLLEGETLMQRVTAHGALPWRAVAHLGEGLTRILAVLEANALVHRDIKPENVLLTAEGEVGLVDFGLARGLRDTRLTSPDAVVGTVGFIPPEQVLGAATPDVRGDLWAVGHTLVYAARGFRPAGDGMAALMASAKEPAVRLEGEWPDAPPALCELIASLTAPKPEDRPISAQAALELFQAVNRQASAEGGTP